MGLLAAGPADADTEFQRGVKAYETGDYAAAVEAFRRAHELDKKPIYLFSWAQSEVGRDRCAEAIGIFRSYLETKPPEQNQKAAEERIATCQEKLADAGATEASSPNVDAGVSDTAPPPATAAPAPVFAPQPVAPMPVAPMQPAPSPAAESPGPWYSDPLGMALLGGGLIATGVGSAFVLSSLSSESDAEAQTFTRYDDHENALDQARRRRLLGGITLGVGVALVAGGVLRLATRSTEPASGAALWIAPGAGGVEHRVRF